MKDSLHHHLARKECEAKVVVTTITFEDFYKTHVEDKLKKFYMVKKARREDGKWRWLPLFQNFKAWPLSYYSVAPWDHTDQNWADMSTVLLENVKTNPLSQ